jgi:hypothetical protein
VSDAFFLLYILLEIISAALLLTLAARGYGMRTRGRVLSAVIGAACLIQAGYLVFFFEGGHYTIALWPFAGPVYAVIRMIRHRRAVRAEEQAAAGRMWGPAGAPVFGTHPAQPWPPVGPQQGLAPGGFASGGLAPGGFAPGGFASGGLAPGGFVPGGLAPGGFASPGPVPGGFVASGPVPGFAPAGLAALGPVPSHGSAGYAAAVPLQGSMQAHYLPPGSVGSPAGFGQQAGLGQ